MRYKVGDKVKIKTWKQLKWECGTISNTNELQAPMQKKEAMFFTISMENHLNAFCKNRIVTIKEVLKEDGCYIMERSGIWRWQDYMVDCLIKEEMLDLILNRWEIMDL